MQHVGRCAVFDGWPVMHQAHDRTQDKASSAPEVSKFMQPFWGHKQSEYIELWNSWFGSSINDYKEEKVSSLFHDKEIISVSI